MAGRMKARVDAALSTLAAPNPSADDTFTEVRLNSYGALYTAATNTAGVHVPATPVESTIYSSAARTGTPTAVTQTNSAGYRGVVVVIDCTASADTPSVVFTIQGYSTLGNDWYTILASAAVTGAETRILRVFPGATAAANTVANDWLPLSWRVDATHADADSITYSVNAILLP